MINGSNGHAPGLFTLPRKTVKFRVGGEDVEVPPIGFLQLDETPELRTHLEALSPEISAVEYAKHVLRIVSYLVQPSDSQAAYDEIAGRALAGETSGIIGAMTELFRISGFPLPEPTATAPVEENPGTGTSTESAPSSPSEASAEGIPSS